ncbi:PorY family sensor histidine kinase [Pontibacter akesuensis]|uniref:histidine kinase n=1 Tax=Pontibacter akesuensis TaxID=388950 RepID=A0A1I7FJ55_9BACT|nr:HAMP domain-containing sensor histidine kinase [Pontibacter akesuensis]GHA61950.1 two-component sensor histidine kinase [Pontibacter akesuensis]SFU36188.1 Signal transduction histidine kinase [Pontibacter akesuensis]
MKLLNHTLSYLAAILFVVITGWSALLYYSLLDEIYDSLDDGLGNYKLLIMQRAAADSTILQRSSFGENNYAIKPIAGPKVFRVTDVYSDTAMFMVNEQDFEPVRMLKTVFRHNGNFYELRVINSMVETDDLVEDLLVSIFWLYLGLIAIILVLNNFLLKKTWQPFYRLVQQLRDFRLEKQHQIKYEETRVEEFQVLHDAVSKLIQNSTDTYQSQKQFIENASHELQTPLAISLNKLELLLEESNLTEEQLRLLAGAVNNLERMKRLNKSLLLLSKIENRQFQVEEEVNINQVIKTLLDDFSDQAEYKGLAVTLVEEGDCRVRMNPDLASVLLTNLLKNAIVHNHQEGFVEVTVSRDKLVVANSGKTSALNEQRMFSRFQQDSPSEASTGLGLPIVKAIANLYRFQVKYSFTGKHILTLSFHPPHQ